MRSKIIISLVVIVLIFILMKTVNKDKRLSKNFVLSEFTKGGKFKPTPKVQKNLKRLVVKILQPLRDYFGKPVNVPSGYRPEYYNEQIGGSETSAHVDGNAADIWIDGVSNNEIIQAIDKLGLPVDQVIDEQKINGSRWVHIAYGDRKQILTARDNELTPGKMSYELIGYLS